MIRYLVNDDGHFWKARVLDDIVVIEHGKIGDEPETDVVDTWDEFQQPPEYSLDDLAAPMFEKGFRFAPIPGVAELIEEAHGAQLPPQVRAFFADGTYWNYQDYRCADLGCEVDFLTDAVLGSYHQEHYDSERETERTFVPISGRMYDGIPDEQQWIGVDPEEAENPKVYALYTSGEFEVAYDSFEGFLDDLSATAD